MSRKPFKTFDEMCNLLVKERGLRCPDLSSLKSYLGRINYYRFSGYAREFQRNPRYGDNRFVEGASFSEIAKIIVADSRLSLLMLQQLGVIEIAVRARFAHEYGREFGDVAFYLDTNNYEDRPGSSIDKPTSIVKGILSDLERDKSRIVNHYANEQITGKDFENRCKRYSEVPIWAAVEVLSFGRISNMITYLRPFGPAKRAAAALGVQWGPFKDIVHSFSVLRNLCAHHRQLWNRPMAIQCPVQKKLRPRNLNFSAQSVYAHVIMANHYRKKIDGDTSVADEIASLLQSDKAFSQGIYCPNPK